MHSIDVVIKMRNKVHILTALEGQNILLYEIDTKENMNDDH